MKDTLEQIFKDCQGRYTGEARLVPGEGDPHAALLIVGEAPGAQEEAQGRPFVGAAGKNLSHFLALAGMRREALYITNAVKFRPTRLGASGRRSNRTPTRQEVAWFAPYLAREIACVCPRVVATLGNTALSAVLCACGCAEQYAALRVGDVHGRPFRPAGGLPWLFPLYHPASLIYRRALTDVYEQDVRALAAFLKTAESDN